MKKILFLVVLMLIGIAIQLTAQNYTLTLPGATTSYASAPDNDALDVAAGSSVTITAWVKTISTSQTVFIAKRPGAAGAGYELWMSTSGYLCANATTTGGTAIGPAAGSLYKINDGNWHHLAYVMDAAAHSSTIYVDGKLEKTNTGFTTAQANTGIFNGGTLYIGMRGTTVQPLNGSIDEIRMYNKALTPAELITDMATTVTSGTANLKAAWNFNEGTGTTLADVMTINPVTITGTGATWLSITPSAPTAITMTSTISKSVGDADFNPASSTTSGIQYSSSNTAVSTVVNNSIHVVASGTSTITASQPANLFYTAGTDVTSTLTVLKANVITFPTIPLTYAGVTDFSPNATASSGLAVTYTSSNTAVATIVSNQIHVVGTGTCTITAAQAGNTEYAAATSVGRTLTIFNLSTSSTESWYHISFTNGGNKDLVLQDNGEGNILTVQGIILGSNNQLWKLQASGTNTGYYTLTSKSGRKVYWDGTASRFKASVSATPVDLKAVGTANATYPTTYEFQRFGGSSGMNPYGGSTAGNQISEYNMADAGNCFNLFAMPFKVSDANNTYWYQINENRATKNYWENGTYNTTYTNSLLATTTSSLTAKQLFKFVKAPTGNGYLIYNYNNTNPYLINTTGFCYQQSTDVTGTAFLIVPSPIAGRYIVKTETDKYELNSSSGRFWNYSSYYNDLGNQFSFTEFINEISSANTTKWIYIRNSNYPNRVMAATTTSGQLRAEDKTTATLNDYQLWKIEGSIGTSEHMFKIINKATGEQIKSATVTTTASTTLAAPNGSDFKISKVEGDVSTGILYNILASGSASPLHNQANNDIVIWTGTSQASKWYIENAPTFNGTGDWSTPTNWTTNTTPTTDAKVIVEGNTTINSNVTASQIIVGIGKSLSVAPGKSLTINNTLINSGTFTLKSDATSGTATVTGNVSGNATVEQHLPAGTERTWWYIASPVTGAAWTVFGSNQVGEYSETSRSYSAPFAATETLTAGKGYVVKMNAAQAANVYQFANKALNNGNISVPLTRTAPLTPDDKYAKRGFNLVGNPYPSYLNWEMAYNASTNIRSTIWYRTKGASAMEFHTYNAALGVSVPTAASGYIPPMQAFWVKVDTDPVSPATESTGTLNFTNAMRGHAIQGTTTPLKAPATNSLPLLRIALSNGSTSDETVIALHANASTNFDQYDSEKMSNTGTSEVFTLAGTQELTINAQPDSEGSKLIPLGIRPASAGSLNLSVSELKNLDNMQIILHDNVLKTETQLSLNESYNFTTDGTATNNRFSIEFRAPGMTTGLENSNFANFNITVYSGKIQIQSPAMANGELIRVYSSNGQKIIEQTAEGNNTIIDHKLSGGIYFVKVSNYVQKIIIH